MCAKGRGETISNRVEAPLKSNAQVLEAVSRRCCAAFPATESTMRLGKKSR
jgi:hypothetical protein